MFTTSTEDIQHYKEAKNSSRGSRKYFPGFLAVMDSTKQHIPRPLDNVRSKLYYSGKKKRYTTVKNQLMVNNHRGYIFIK